MTRAARCSPRPAFEAYTGEILGVAGIAGSGQKELLEAIAGLQPLKSGSIEYTNRKGHVKELTRMTPEEIREIGIRLAFVPEDRLGMGLVASMGMTGQYDAAQLQTRPRLLFRAQAAAHAGRAHHA